MGTRTQLCKLATEGMYPWLRTTVKKISQGSSQNRGSNKEVIGRQPSTFGFIQPQTKQWINHNLFSNQHFFQICRRSLRGHLSEKSIPATGVLAVQKTSKFSSKILGDIAVVGTTINHMHAGEALGGEYFIIAFTCFQNELMLALQSAVPSFSLAMCNCLCLTCLTAYLYAYLVCLVHRSNNMPDHPNCLSEASWLFVSADMLIPARHSLSSLRSQGKT